MEDPSPAASVVEGILSVLLVGAGLAEFARAGLREPAFVRLDAEQQLSPDLTSAFFTVR